MATVKNLTTQQIQHIQIDEGLLYIDFGEVTEKLIAPTRGGGEFNVSNSIREIEFDGKMGKTKGMDVIESQAATLKVTTLDSSQDSLALAIPGAVVSTSEGVTTITNPKCGVIAADKYLKNVTMFAKLIGGTYKKITIFNPMHDGDFAFKAVQKGENENALEFSAHFDPSDDTNKFWKIDEVESLPATGV